MTKAAVIAGGIAIATVAVAWLVTRQSGSPGSTVGVAAPVLSGGRFHGSSVAFSGYGWSVDPDTRTAVSQALASALGKEATEPDVTFVFYSHQHAPERIVDALARRKRPTQRICGWSSAYGVITPDGYHSAPEGVVGLMSLRLPHVRVGVGAAAFDDADRPEPSVRLALRRAIEDSGHPEAGERPSMILMSATYAGNEEKILKALDSVTGGEVPVLGGTAAGGPAHPASDWSLIANGDVIRNGLVLCVLYSSSPFGWSFRGGFRRTGKSGVVTASEGRVIREIDGRPALDVYDEWSGGRVREAMGAGKDMNTFTGLYPLCRIVKSGDTTHNLFAHVWPPGDGAASKCLVTSASVWKGDVVYFSEGSWNILLNRIGHLPRLAKETSQGTQPAAALFICCEGVLKNVPVEQRDQMAHLMNKSLGDVPWIGAFTWGEQGNFPGVGNYHGNLLTSVALFPEAPGGGE